MSKLTYPGNELQAFSKAVNWKKYVARHMKPYIKGCVLEVGAGIGSNTLYLMHQGIEDWLCLEPDSQNLKTLKKKITHNELCSRCRTQLGTLATIGKDEMFDTILYYDVLEHIKNDNLEVINAFSHLRPGGNLIILAPAHQSMFSAFDAAIGHFRRYNKVSLRAVMGDGMKEITCIYLDCFGFLAYKIYSTFAKKRNISGGNVKLWDKLLIPLSVIFDRIFNYRIGKSILGIYQRNLNK
ncbi:MAG: class I SAM-dependent methyltransferase [Bacteroidota bacterium]